MEVKMESNDLLYRKFKISKENKFVLIAIVTLILSFTYLSFSNNYVFHTSAEIFGAVISFGIFILTINTYKISKNNFFMFLGIGYFFVGILDLFHAFSYREMNMFINGSINMVAQFCVAARAVEVETVLISTLLLYKIIKKPNFIAIIFADILIFIFLILAILHFNILPVYLIEGVGLTKDKIIAEYIITFSFLISVIIFYKARLLMDKSLFIYILISLIIKVMSQICFTIFTVNTDVFFTIGHILKVISFYLLYKGIIVNGLQRPFDMLINNLNKADNTLKEIEEQRKYMEQAILQNELCYELIINHSRDGIAIIRENKLIFANSTAVNILGGKDISCILNKNSWEFIDKSYLEQTKKRLNELINNKINLPFIELKLLNLDDKTIEVESSLNYIIYRGKPSVLTIFRDLSTQKKIISLNHDIVESEKKLGKSNEYNIMLTEFFSNISHELKTPLNVILCAIQILLIPNDEISSMAYRERFTKYLCIMKQNSYRLVRLINNLIDISKYDSGYLKLNKHNLNIISIVEDISLSVTEYVKFKGINIIFDTDTEEKIMAIDEDKIERIILNLLSNAIKFTNKDGNIFVNLEDKGEKIRISVKDTGVGIPEDKMNLIFERFGQVDKTFTINREGSGIGLSLVKTLVELHGGNIKVKSILGVGSEFIIELPVTIIEDEEESECALTFDNKVDKITIEFSDIYSNNSDM